MNVLISPQLKDNIREVTKLAKLAMCGWVRSRSYRK